MTAPAPHDGTPGTVARCDYCGTEQPEGSAFCQHCTDLLWWERADEWDGAAS